MFSPAPVAFVFPSICWTDIPVDTCSVVSLPVLIALCCRNPLVWVSTAAATAATSTIAMNTIMVPIPTCPLLSFSNIKISPPSIIKDHRLLIEFTGYLNRFFALLYVGTYVILEKKRFQMF